MQFFSLNKGENWFAALTNIAILKIQNYWREMITCSISSLVKIWKISYGVFSVSYCQLYNKYIYASSCRSARRYFLCTLNCDDFIKFSEGYGKPAVHAVAFRIICGNALNVSESCPEVI